MTGDATSAPGGPVVDAEGVRFVLGDPYRRLAAVRLEPELDVPQVDFVRERTQWSLRVPRPPVDRMEYLFGIEDHNGHRTTVTDPRNPRRAPGAFGEKSVLEFAEYAPPAWLDAPAVSGTQAYLAVAAPLLAGEITGVVWSPDGLARSDPAPLLVVHDGPEYAALGLFLRYLQAGMRAGWLPPVRAALLAPGERNEWYSANPDYADSLVESVLPALPPATVVVGVGVSLGALAMLHAHRRHGCFDGLFLQSGSFFTPDLDGQESGFSGFDAVTRFVAGLGTDGTAVRAVPTVLTCGIVEENLANNRRIADALSDLGFPVAMHTVRDAHNYTAWRDALHPHLTTLVRAIADARAA